MKMVIRISNHGKANHPFWWIIVQPYDRSHKGFIYEKLGHWFPRQTKTVDRAIIVNRPRIAYWIGHGAQITEGARKLFEKAGILPKRPPPFGSLFLYEKPERGPVLKVKPHLSRHFASEKLYGKILLQEEMSKLIKRGNLENEAIERGKIRAEEKQIKTTDIEANDPDAESRLKSFMEISKRLKDHLGDMGDLTKGSDYKTSMYLRKLNLLAKKDFGLDVEGAKRYMENMKQIEKLKQKEKEGPFDWVEQYTYPLGVRYYQSYYDYLEKYPMATLSDYRNHCNISHIYKLVNRECTFEDFVEIYKAAIFEIFELRYALKVARNDAARDMARLLEFDKKVKEPPIPPLPKVDFMPPSKGYNKRLRRRTVHKRANFTTESVVQAIDLTLSASDTLDEILTGKMFTRGREVKESDRKKSSEGTVEEKVLPVNSSAEQKKEEVPKKEERSEPHAAEDIVAEEKKEESTEGAVAEEKKEKSPEKPAAEPEQKLEYVDPVGNVEGYERLYNLTLEDTRVQRPLEGEDEAKEKEGPLRKKKLVARMRPYSIEYIDENEINKTHEQNLEALRKVLGSREFRETIYQTFEEFREQFIEADAPFTIAMVAEQFAGYQVEKPFETDPKADSKYEYIPTPTSIVPRIPAVVDPTLMHADTFSLRSTLKDSQLNRKRTTPRFRVHRWRKHFTLRDKRRPFMF